MNPYTIIKEFYKSGTELYEYLVVHSELVTAKALLIAKKNQHLNLDLDFIYQAALLHDIGIFKTNAIGIGCKGTDPYLAHGIIGREILETLGYPQHALVCERHVGVGITKNEIIERNLPLPIRDMLPITHEEIIICYADKFYSKGNLRKEKKLDRILEKLKNRSEEAHNRFLEWHCFYNHL